jgi:hypothetical protein
MTIKEKVTQIIYFKEFNDKEKLASIRALVPDKIRRVRFSEMAKLTPQELLQFGAALKVAEAMYEILKAEIRKQKRAQKRKEEQAQ